MYYATYVSDGDVFGAGVCSLLKIFVIGSLTSLNLEDNALGAEGARMLAPAIAANGSMTRLNVSWNSLGEWGKAPLRKAIEGRPGFELEL